jgi:hypothetical protein
MTGFQATQSPSENLTEPPPKQKQELNSSKTCCDKIKREEVNAEESFSQIKSQAWGLESAVATMTVFAGHIYIVKNVQISKSIDNTYFFAIFLPVLFVKFVYF